jgi:hypothetical protein
MEQREIFEGYLLDVACARKYPRLEMLERAAAHTRDCALMGHCIESGYVVVGQDGRIQPLDTAATLSVVDAVREGESGKDIKLRVVRERRGDEMVTCSVTRL